MYEPLAQESFPARLYCLAGLQIGLNLANSEYPKEKNRFIERIASKEKYSVFQDPLREFVTGISSKKPVEGRVVIYLKALSELSEGTGFMDGLQRFLIKEENFENLINKEGIITLANTATLTDYYIESEGNLPE